MQNLFIAEDGSSTAWASAWPHRLGYIGVVNFSPAGRNFNALRHECIGIRDTLELALEDARGDARRLVEMWMDQVHIDDL